MESVACNYCRSWNAETVFVGRDLLHGLPAEFPIRHCRECGLFYLSPRPDRGEIAYYYPEDYGPHNVVAIADRSTALARWVWQRAMDKRLQTVLPYVRERGRALDIGCATGGFLESMRHLGWQSFGVEPNQKAVTYARERFGLDVFCGELEQAGYPTDFFDLVTLWDVLEHLHDPLGTLQEVARVIKPGGTLAINVPNPDGIEARLFGPYWTGWDVPRHLNVFPQATLWNLLGELGFGRVAVTSNVHSTGGLPISFGYWVFALTDRITLGRLATRMLASWPARVVLAPYFYILSYFNTASFVTVIARRVGTDERC